MIFEQSEEFVKEKTVRMHRRGVRRIFTVWVEDQRVCEWSPEIQDWRPLEASAEIEDSCFIVPLAVAALFDAEEADKAVVKALAAKGNPVIRRLEAEAKAKGWAEAFAKAILIVLEVRGVAVSPAQQQEILSCRDPKRRDLWLRRAVLASSAVLQVP